MDCLRSGIASPVSGRAGAVTRAETVAVHLARPVVGARHCFPTGDDADWPARQASVFRVLV